MDDQHIPAVDLNIFTIKDMPGRTMDDENDLGIIVVMEESGRMQTLGAVNHTERQFSLADKIVHGGMKIFPAHVKNSILAVLYYKSAEKSRFFSEK
jgi:hypothetical protein